METITKQKVLFLITKSNWGGAQRYVFDLATSLNPTQFEVVVALGGDGDLKIKLNEVGIRTISIQGLTRDISLLQEPKVIIDIIKNIKSEKPDVLHVNSSKSGVIGTIVGRLLRVPNVIFTAHGWAFNETRPWWQLCTIKILHWITVLFSHHTITVSTTLKIQMDWIWVQNKMSVINPGRTIITFKSKREARGILETKTIDNIANLADYHTDPWLGTIAELHPIKCLNRAIDSVASLSRTIPNIRYVIIGDGQLKHALQQQVQDLGLEKHVFFTGSIHEAARFLPAFDVFVLPSESEAFGYVLLEAGLAHVPVVATNTGGITDIITHNETGLLVPIHDTPALTNALQALLTDKKLSKKLSDTHQLHAKTCTVEKMVKETISIYVK